MKKAKLNLKNFQKNTTKQWNSGQMWRFDCSATAQIQFKSAVTFIATLQVRLFSQISEYF